MCGSDTLTTVVSSTSMKVLNITEMAMIQGLISGLISPAAGWVAMFQAGGLMKLLDGFWRPFWWGPFFLMPTPPPGGTKGSLSFVLRGVQSPPPAGGARGRF